MVGSRPCLSWKYFDSGKYLKQRLETNVQPENTRYSLYQHHRILICAPINLSEIPYPEVSFSTRFCALDDVQLFHLGRYINKMVARILCSHAQWLKEPA